MSSKPDPSIRRVASATDLEALVGVYVTGESPEQYWVDSHGLFEFPSEAEARHVVSDPYYQQFLPDVDWSKTVIHKRKVYPEYSSNPAVLWKLIENTSTKHGPLSVVKKLGRWWASFGNSSTREARSAGVAICLAALNVVGIAVEIDHDRIDAELGHRTGALDDDDSQTNSGSPL